MYRTGEQGFLCRCVYVKEILETKRSFSVFFELDRNLSSPVIKYSLRSGGVFKQIECHFPEEVFQIEIDYLKNLEMH